MMRTNLAHHRERLTITGQAHSREAHDAIGRFIEYRLLSVVVGLALGLIGAALVLQVVDAVPGLLLPTHVVSAGEREAVRVWRGGR